MLENDSIVTPKLGATVGYSGLDGDGAFGSMSAGVNLQTPEGWNLEAGLLFNIEGDGRRSDRSWWKNVCQQAVPRTRKVGIIAPTSF